MWYAFIINHHFYLDCSARCNHAGYLRISQPIRLSPRRSGPWNWIPHFFAFEACSTATIWPFIWASSAAVCLSPPTKNAAGQKMTIAAAVTTPSFVR